MVDVCKQSHSFTKSILMLNLKLKSWMLSKLTSFQENPAKCVATGIWILELFLICIKTKPSKNPHFIKVSILKLKHTQFICLENFISGMYPQGRPVRPPKFSVTLTLSLPGGADSVHHRRGASKFSLRLRPCLKEIENRKN